MRSRLLERCNNIVETVSEVCGVQAQVLKAAMMSALVRTEGRTLKDVEDALWKEGVLTKTWCMRGTLHLLPTDELPLYTKAFGDHLRKSHIRYLKSKGLSERRIDEMLEVVREIVGSEPLTKDDISREITHLFGNEAGDWVKHSWGVFLRLGCFEGTIKFGPQRGTNVTFVETDHLDTDITEEEALVEVFMKYMHAYGPATPQDFAYWSGLKITQAKKVFADCKSSLKDVQVGEQKMWIPEEDLDILKGCDGKGDSIALLPYFDTYLLAHKDKSLIIQGEHYKKIYRTAGWIYPAVLHNGRVVGIWSYDDSKKGLDIAVEPLEDGGWIDHLEDAGMTMARALGKDECNISNIY